MSASLLPSAKPPNRLLRLFIALVYFAVMGGVALIWFWWTTLCGSC